MLLEQVASGSKRLDGIVLGKQNIIVNNNNNDNNNNVDFFREALGLAIVGAVSQDFRRENSGISRGCQACKSTIFSLPTNVT